MTVKVFNAFIVSIAIVLLNLLYLRPIFCSESRNLLIESDNLSSNIENNISNDFKSNNIQRRLQANSQHTSSNYIITQRTMMTSPTPGSDISRPFQLLKMYNISHHIVPKLELTRTFNVYFCKHTGDGIRFYYVAREGLLLHPRINLVDNPDNAEIIIYLPVSAAWTKTECNKPQYKNKTIVLDEADGSHLFEPPPDTTTKDKWLLYFKRSYVDRENGRFLGYMGYLSRGDVFPMTYTTLESYFRLEYRPMSTSREFRQPSREMDLEPMSEKELEMMSPRDLEIVSTLRGSAHDPTRLRVREWLEQYVIARGIVNGKYDRDALYKPKVQLINKNKKKSEDKSYNERLSYVGEFNSDNRREISTAYFNLMSRARYDYFYSIC